MKIFRHIIQHDAQSVIYCVDQVTNLKAIIAIHNTNLGPALGGIRFTHYKSEEEALIDVLRLAQGMTYKAAIANLELGGGKSVIISNDLTQKEKQLLSFAKFIEDLNGKYIGAPDVNTTSQDMITLAQHTKHIASLPKGKGGSGDPTIFTAYGIYVGMKAALKKVYGSESFNKKKILVEGVGKLGTELVHLLHPEKAKIYISDVSQEKIHTILKIYPDLEVVALNELYTLPMDIYSPCAIGATIHDRSIKQLQCAIIAGGANNQLADEEKHGEMLVKKSIIYLPDFLINSGGLINASQDVTGNYDEKIVKQKIETIYDTSLKLIQQAETEQSNIQTLAKQLAEKRFKIIH